MAQEERLPLDRRMALFVAEGTREALMAVVIRHCKLGYDGIYLWQNFQPAVDALRKVSDIFKKEMDEANNKSTVGQAIILLERGAEELRKNPFALESIMNEIDNFWGIETGRLEKEEDEQDPHDSDDPAPM